MRAAAAKLTIGILMAVAVGMTSGRSSIGAPKAKTIRMSVTEKGFEPSVATVKKGQPVTLVITRKTEMTCAKEIVIEEEGINTKLPLNKAVEVTFTPKKTGELKYACAMDMITGVLKVE